MPYHLAYATEAQDTPLSSPNDNYHITASFLQDFLKDIWGPKPVKTVLGLQHQASLILVYEPKSLFKREQDFNKDIEE